MGRRNQDQDQLNDRSKVRIFYAEADGSSQSVQDLLRTLGAVVRPPVLAQPNNRIGRLPAPPLPSPDDPPAERTLFDELEEPDDVLVQDDDVVVESETNGQRKRRGEGPKVDRNAGVTAVADLDFVPNGKQSLKALFAEKSPKKDTEQVLVIGHFLQNALGLESFGPGHILAGYLHVEKPVPVDLKATIRNVKKKVWFSYTDIDKCRVTTEGDNYVKHMLPKVKPK